MPDNSKSFKKKVVLIYANLFLKKILNIKKN